MKKTFVSMLAVVAMMAAAGVARAADNLADGRTTLNVKLVLLDKLAAGTISGKIAKEVFEALWNGEGSVDAIIDKRGLVQISDSASIDKLVAEVIAANPGQVEQFRAGKQQVLGFLVGQIMKASRGKANPQQVNEALRKQLGP